MRKHPTSEHTALRTRLRLAGCVAWIAAAVFLSCQQERRTAHRVIAGEPAMAAIVITIQTTIQPENKVFLHSLVVGNDRARSGDEVDQWRLFDLHDDQVTYVDDIAHTYRRQSMSSILHDLDAALGQPLPSGIPRAQLVRTGLHRAIEGTDAEEIELRAGNYTRQMWIGKHPLIPPKLFAMMLASAPSRSPLLPMMKSVDDILLDTEGFPLADHAELAFGTNRKLVVDANVVKIERRNVPQSWLNVSAAYRDVTPPPTPRTRKR